MSRSLSVDHVARIEGHGRVHVEVDGGVVRDVHMEVLEPARYFETMVVGRRIEEIPLITSRICGICSPNHVVTAISALEAGLGVEVSARTETLRKLLVYGSFLQNHATHLYLFVTPDHVGLPSVFPLERSHPDVVERALRIKRVGNELTTMVGGRSVHPITAVIGGFTCEPSPQDLERVRAELDRVVDDAVATVKLCADFDAHAFTTSGELLALFSSDEYAICGREVAALDAGWRRSVDGYRSFIEENASGQGSSKHATVGGRTFMVGALSRVSLSSALLTDRARAAISSYAAVPMPRNPFLNNLSQAVELIDAAERCTRFIDQLLDESGDSRPVAYSPRRSVGVGATEAPRGTLYHSYEIDGQGVVRAADIITPTAQNLANLDADLRAFAPRVVGLPRDEFIHVIERLVRAYDPCLSCSVH